MTTKEYAERFPHAAATRHLSERKRDFWAGRLLRARDPGALSRHIPRPFEDEARSEAA